MCSFDDSATWKSQARKIDIMTMMVGRSDECCAAEGYALFCAPTLWIMRPGRAARTFYLSASLSLAAAPNIAKPSSVWCAQGLVWYSRLIHACASNSAALIWWLFALYPYMVKFVTTLFHRGSKMRKFLLKNESLSCNKTIDFDAARISWFEVNASNIKKNCLKETRILEF